MGMMVQAYPAPIYGVVVDEDDELVDGASVVVNASGFPVENATTDEGAWQVDVGPETGEQWPVGTTFTVTVSKGSYVVMKTAMVQEIYTNVGTMMLSQNDSLTNAAPVAVISSGSVYEVVVDSLVYFSASASSDADGSITGFRWDFDGDGVFDTSWMNTDAITHSYQDPGLYTLILQVKDDAGLMDSDDAVVDVSGDDVGVQIKAKRTGLTNQNISFAIETQGDVDLVNYSWDFDDGSGGFQSTVFHEYISPGVFLVTVMGRDSANQTYADVHEITILLDTDGDLLPNEVEERVGSSIWTKNNYLSIQFDSSIHYLIDSDNDKVFDCFYNESSQQATMVELMNTSYLIDDDNDSVFEYRFNVSSGVLSEYVDTSKSSSQDSPGVSFLFLLLVCILVVLSQRKRSD